MCTRWLCGCKYKCCLCSRHVGRAPFPSSQMLLLAVPPKYHCLCFNFAFFRYIHTYILSLNKDNVYYLQRGELIYLRENYSFVCPPTGFFLFSSVPGFGTSHCGLSVYSRGGIFQNSQCCLEHCSGLCGSNNRAEGKSGKIAASR